MSKRSLCDVLSLLAVMVIGVAEVSVAEKISNNILSSYGDNLIGEFEDIRFVDRTLELQEQQEYSKSHSIDEIRTKYYSDDALGDERGSMLPLQIAPAPMMMKSMAIPAPDLFKPKDEKIGIELDKWQRKAERLIQSDGGDVCDFQSDIIPIELRAKVLSMLAGAKTAGDIVAIFKAVKSERPEQYGDFAPLVAALTDATQALRETA